MKIIDVPLVGWEPTYAHLQDAGADLVSRVDAFIEGNGGVKLIPTGTYLNVPEGYEAQIRPRSGLALKFSVTVLNTPGTVDAGYTGEVGVIIINCGPEIFYVERGMKIGQLVFNEIVHARFVRVESHTETARKDGGFGSTGA
jgi:dUTP pyrophosphatase